MASSVPSPPSAIGTMRMIASLRARRIPLAIASATCSALSEPLKESGAITTTGGGEEAEKTTGWAFGMMSRVMNLLEI
jgi:hypothetical protein